MRRRLELGVAGRKPSGSAKTETAGRNRWETRELTVFPAKAWFRDTPWEKLIETVLRLERTVCKRAPATGLCAQTTEVVFWISSASNQMPRSWNEWIRAHWRIENGLALHFRWVGVFQEAAVADGGRQGNSGRAQGEAGGGTRGGADDEALAFVLDLGFGQGIQIGDDFRPGAGATEPGNAIFQRGFQHQRKEAAKHVAADRLVELVEDRRVATRCLAVREVCSTIHNCL